MEGLLDYAKSRCDVHLGKVLSKASKLIHSENLNVCAKGVCVKSANIDRREAIPWEKNGGMVRICCFIIHDVAMWTISLKKLRQSGS